VSAVTATRPASLVERFSAKLMIPVKMFEPEPGRNRRLSLTLQAGS
jgi:hypothetical protein